jgi:hypothetical protein
MAPVAAVAAAVTAAADLKNWRLFGFMDTRVSMDDRIG